MREGNGPNGQATFVVTCVHGTWGRGFFSPRSGYQPQSPVGPSVRRWFEPASAFQQNIEQALRALGLQAKFDYFEWSGDNSVFERDKAGGALAERLRSQSERFPGHTKVIIAHSHGGNVAMRALHRLSGTPETIRVVTLATPFVDVFYTPGDNWDERSSRVLGVAVMIPLFVLLYLLGDALSISGAVDAWAALSALAFAGFAVIGRNSRVARWCFLTVLAVGALFAELEPVAFLALVLAVAVCWFVPVERGAETIGRWLIGPFTSSNREVAKTDASVRQLILASALPGMLSPPRSLLVLRGVDDEAALALAAGAGGARLSRVLMTMLTRLDIAIVWTLVALSILILVAAAVSLVLGGGVGPAVMFLESLSLWALVAVDLIALVLVCLPLGLTLTVLMCCALKSVHGRELMHGSVVLDVVSNSVPDSLGEVDAITLPHDRRSRQGLRHALYNHPEVPRFIVAWLCASHEGSDAKRRFGSLVDEYYASSEGSDRAEADP